MGNAVPKAERVAESIDLRGKNAIVTGGSAGIGEETARVLAMRGADVIIACRDVEKGNRSVEKIKKEKLDGSVSVMQCDLSSFKSIREFSQKFNALKKPLHLLVNNAGTLEVKMFKETKDGYEMQFGVNHLGHFLLTNLLHDALKSGAPSRVVTVASRAHEWAQDLNKIKLPPTKEEFSTKSYGTSKLCNILFARELNRRWSSDGITSVSLHPGVVRTDIGRGSSCTRIIFSKANIFFRNTEHGAATTVFCSIAPKIEGGAYYADLKVVKPNAHARDDEMANKLWNMSAKWVGLSS